jgi:RNA polymerase sigma-70 factor (ECF subfamily)
VGIQAGRNETLLLERLRAGEHGAFEDLVIAHQHQVFGVALRMLGNEADAQDAAQEVFLRAHQGMARFRGEARLSTWLYSIASRVCLSRLSRRRGRPARGGEEVLERIPSPHGNPGEALEEGELGAALLRAIADLAEERRIVVVLRDLEGLPYEEIAEILGLPLNTVRSRLHRARMELKDRLERFLP